ncbi:MAG: histidine phosphatase family protein [Bacteroidota bacterium]
MLTVYFIRHAESEANADHTLICGRSDHMPLSPRGRAQTKLIAERLKREQYQFDHIYSSVSIRALETAQASARALSFPQADIQQTDQLVELSKGEWEGRVRSEMYTEAIQQEVRDHYFDFAPPGGESQRAAEARMLNWMEAIKTKHLGKSQRIAAFSHGFAIKTLTAALLDSDRSAVYRTIIHNTSITAFKWDGEKWMLERLNDHAHLAQTEFVPHY